MITLKLVLMILALVCLFLASISTVVPRVQLGWLGLALWLLAIMIS